MEDTFSVVFRLFHFGGDAKTSNFNLVLSFLTISDLLHCLSATGLFFFFRYEGLPLLLPLDNV